MKKIVIGTLLVVLSPPSFANKIMPTVLATKAYHMLHSPTQSAAFSSQLSSLLRVPIRLKDLREDDLYTLFASQESIADRVRTLLAEKYGWSLRIDESAFNQDSLPSDHIDATNEYELTDKGQEILATMKERGFLGMLFNPDNTPLYEPMKGRTVNPLYKTMDGQANFADEYYNGEMDTAYNTVVRNTEKDVYIPINIKIPPGWYLFRGTTEAYYRIKQAFIDYFYQQIDFNHMMSLLKEELFGNILVVLKYIFTLDGGLTQKIANSYLREHLLDETGVVREEYKYPQGLHLFASRYFAYEVDEAYHLTKTHLDRDLFKQLEWEGYQEVASSGIQYHFEKQPGTYSDLKTGDIIRYASGKEYLVSNIEITPGTSGQGGMDDGTPETWRIFLKSVDGQNIQGNLDYSPNFIRSIRGFYGHRGELFTPFTIIERIQK